MIYLQNIKLKDQSNLINLLNKFPLSLLLLLCFCWRAVSNFSNGLPPLTSNSPAEVCSTGQRENTPSWYLYWQLRTRCAHLEKIGYFDLQMHQVTSGESTKPIFFLVKRLILLDTCATCSQLPSYISTLKYPENSTSKSFISTVCPRSLNSFYIVTYYIGIMGQDFLDIQYQQLL